MRRAHDRAFVPLAVATCLVTGEAGRSWHRSRQCAFPLGKPDLAVYVRVARVAAEAVIAALGRAVDARAAAHQAGSGKRFHSVPANATPGAAVATTRSRASGWLPAAAAAAVKCAHTLAALSAVRRGATSVPLASAPKGAVVVCALGLPLLTLLALGATTLKPAGHWLLRRCHVGLPSKWHCRWYSYTSCGRNGWRQPPVDAGSRTVPNAPEAGR